MYLNRRVFVMDTVFGDSSPSDLKTVPVIYLQFYTYASQDSLGLYKVSPTRKSLRPLQNFPLLLFESRDSLRFKMWVPKQKCEYGTRDAQVKKSLQFLDTF